ncbi:MAG: hypothetical protein FJW86_02445 [Actinobacteria bacterium]|nr:hypothetical protein [Actinomycetota bacterium]
MACPDGGGNVNVTLTWSTDKTTGVSLRVDGTSLGSFSSDGNAVVPFSCPATQHIYVLTATGENGVQLQRQVIVAGILPASTTTSST